LTYKWRDGLKNENYQRLNSEELTNRLYPVLLSIARRHLPEDYIQDVVQETISRFLSNSQQGQVIENREGYLIGILKNVIKENQRSLGLHSLEIHERPDTVQTQEELLQEEEQQQIVRRCFGKLSANCQELLYLHVIEDRSFNELERLLGEPHSTLHRRCRENLKKLAGELKKYGIYLNKKS
jgi:RNA polymerase sigma factor (sigma-70 family)